MAKSSLFSAILFLFVMLGTGSHSRAADIEQDLMLEGEPIQGGLIIARTRSDAEVSIDGRSIRVSPDGVFLVGFTRDHEPTSTLKITFNIVFSGSKVCRSKR